MNLMNMISISSPRPTSHNEMGDPQNPLTTGAVPLFVYIHREVAYKRIPVFVNIFIVF